MNPTTDQELKSQEIKRSEQDRKDILTYLSCINKIRKLYQSQEITAMQKLVRADPDAVNYIQNLADYNPDQFEQVWKYDKHDKHLRHFVIIYQLREMGKREIVEGDQKLFQSCVKVGRSRLMTGLKRIELRNLI